MCWAQPSSSCAGLPFPGLLSIFQFFRDTCEAGPGVVPFPQALGQPLWSDTFQAEEVGEAQALHCPCPSQLLAVIYPVCSAEGAIIPTWPPWLEERALVFLAFTSIW